LQPNSSLAKKLPKNCEAANILIGQVDFLRQRVMALCRLETAATMGDLTEVAIPTRVVFLLLTPADTIDEKEIWHASETARTLGVLFSDKVGAQLDRRGPGQFLCIRHARQCRRRRCFRSVLPLRSSVRPFLVNFIHQVNWQQTRKE